VEARRAMGDGMRIVSISLDDLDIRISKLREQADKLNKEAEEIEAFRRLAVEFGTETFSDSPIIIASTRKTRRQEIIDYLVAQGRHTRKDICEATGIPDGTVAYEMRDKDTFVQNRDGTWDVVSALRQPIRSRPEFGGVDEDDVPF
jgi:hypothetical protein